MLSRRSFIAGATGLLLTSGHASALGGFGSPGVWETVMSMHGVAEGNGPTVNILVARGCDKSGHVWSSTRCLLDRLRVRWLPVYEGVEANRPFVAAALGDSSTATLARVIMGEDQSVSTTDAMLGVANDQERIYSTVLARKLWESTGRTPAMPSYVYKDARGRTKVIDGALRPERYADLLIEAS